MILHGSSALFAWLTEELHHITDLGQNGMKNGALWPERNHEILGFHVISAGVHGIYS